MRFSHVCFYDEETAHDEGIHLSNKSNIVVCSYVYVYSCFFKTGFKCEEGRHGVLCLDDLLRQIKKLHHEEIQRDGKELFLSKMISV